MGRAWEVGEGGCAGIGARQLKTIMARFGEERWPLATGHHHPRHPHRPPGRLGADRYRRRHRQPRRPLTHPSARSRPTSESPTEPGVVLFADKEGSGSG